MCKHSSQRLFTPPPPLPFQIIPLSWVTLPLFEKSLIPALHQFSIYVYMYVWMDVCMFVGMHVCIPYIPCTVVMSRLVPLVPTSNC